jgi:germacradienol/geosmin synthase
MITIPLRPPGAPPAIRCPITIVWAQVWPGLADGMSVAWQDRFAVNWGRFQAAHAYEISVTARGEVLDLDSYVALRRVSVGIQHSLDAAERSGRFEIPPQACTHSLMRELRLAAVDVIAFMNDIHSLEREENRGDQHNLVTVLSRKTGLSRVGAISQAVRMVEGRLADLRDLEARMPAMCRELKLPAAREDDVRHGVAAIHHWIRGNHDWALRTGRYGTEGTGVDVNRYADDLLTTQPPER